MASITERMDKARNDSDSIEERLHDELEKLKKNCQDLQDQHEIKKNGHERRFKST